MNNFIITFSSVTLVIPGVLASIRWRNIERFNNFYMLWCNADHARLDRFGTS
jgi:hypothetical protein